PAHTTASGRSDQNSKRQPPADAAAAASVAPLMGPNTLPAACSPTTEPRATARQRLRYRSAARARDSGTSPPPPRPWMKRPPTSQGSPANPKSPDVAVITDPRANAARQASNTGILPRASE